MPRDPRRGSCNGALRLWPAGPRLLCLALALLASLTTASATSESQFLSVDCGYQGNNYTTGNPSVEWISDEPFVDSGVVNYLYDLPEGSNTSKSISTLRSFPNGTKNCYDITMPSSGRYLVRMSFWYLNYDARGLPPVFNVSIGLTVTGTISLEAGNEITVEYIVNVANTTVNGPASLKICLIRMVSDPIINSIEIRGLPTKSYNADDLNYDVLRLWYRLSTGKDALDLDTFRYPYDALDRIWTYDFSPSMYGSAYSITPLFLGSNSTTKQVAGLADGNPNYIPQYILQTNRQTMDAFAALNYTFYDLLYPQTYHVFLYFAELETGPVSVGSRVFNISFNDKTVKSNYDVYAAAGERKFKAVTLSFPLEQTSSTFFLRFQPNQLSTLTSAIISGIEIYQTNIAPLPVSSDQINALLVFKDTLDNGDELSDWTGDPCNPIEWSGVKCSFSQLSNHIIELDLSSRNLSGPIADSLGALSYLKRLMLDNNDLYGDIPNSLGSITTLNTLLLQNNMLSGSIPASLSSLQNLRIFNVANNSLSGEIPFQPSTQQIITLTGNNELCSSDGSFSLPLCSGSPPPPSSVPATSTTISPPPAKKKSGISFVTILVIIILLGAAIGLSLLCILRSRPTSPTLPTKKGGTESDLLKTGSNLKSVDTAPRSEYPYLPKESTLPGMVDAHRAKVFTLEELKRATGNFSLANQIGVGGFGCVFKATLSDGTVVAVKKREGNSSQGDKEFHTEVGLLSRVHHRHLVPLVGFCSEGEHQALVYQFMAKGSLREQLYDNYARQTGKLSWHARLSIALGAARGIDYLHTGSNPSIIHRDIKTSNILLDDQMVAYVADLGLSRLGPDGGQSTVSTLIKGTVGYLDPEYYAGGQNLSDRSDVYSFGVVLLELITGRPALDVDRTRPDWSIVEWCRSNLQKGKIETILDPTLKKHPGSFNLKTVWKVAESAIICVEPASQNRPCMSEVVRELKEACEIEGIPTEVGQQQVRRESSHTLTIDVTDEV